MKKYYYTIILVLFFSLCSEAQIKSPNNSLKNIENSSRALLYSNPDSALELAYQGVALSKKLNDKYSEADFFNLVAIINIVYGQYVSALEYNINSLKIREYLADSAGIARSLGNISIVYTDQGNYREALNYLFKSLSIANKIADEEIVLIQKTNIGDNYEKLGLVDSAIYFTTQSIYTAAKIKDTLAIAVGYNNLGNINFKNKKYIEAVQYYNKSIALFQLVSDADGKCESLVGQANSFYSLGNYDSAMYCGQLAFKVASDNSILKWKHLSAGLLSGIYEKINKFDSAYFYSKVMNLTRDSLFNLESVRKLEVIKKNEELRQEKILKEAEEVKRKKRQTLELLIIASLISTLFLLIIFLKRIHINIRVVELFGVFTVLLFFEFSRLVIEPLLDDISHHSPFIKLVLLIIFALILGPLHHFTERWMKLRIKRN